MTHAGKWCRGASLGEAERQKLEAQLSEHNIFIPASEHTTAKRTHQQVYTFETLSNDQIANLKSQCHVYQTHAAKRLKGRTMGYFRVQSKSLAFTPVRGHSMSSDQIPLRLAWNVPELPENPRYFRNLTKYLENPVKKPLMSSRMVELQDNLNKAEVPDMIKVGKQGVKLFDLTWQ